MTSSQTGGGSPERPIATKVELLRRLDARAKPQVERRLTPNGAITTLVNRENAQSNEARIKALQTSLQSASARLRSDMSKGFARDKARANFERNR